jgi:2,3-bisphosphoglycerate-independent phosphoglycerate mutase
MDGYGIPKHEVGSAIDAARKPTLDRLFANYPNIRLRAHGTAVGMPSDDDMGNSEVGHNAIGAGQVYAQGAALVANAIADGAIWQGEAWQQIVAGAKAGRTEKRACSTSSACSPTATCTATSTTSRRWSCGQGGGRQDGAHPRPARRPRRARDQRAGLRGALRGLPAGHQHRRLRRPHRLRRRPPVHHHGPLRRQLADGGAGWRTHVLGEGPQFANATEAVNGLREKHPGTIDQDLPEFVIADGGQPIGTIEDGDSVVFYNFRGDRAIEITRAFVEEDFDKFDRVRHPRVTYAGMLQYDGDLQLPKRFLVAPPAIKDTSGEWFSKSGLAQFACSETQKFGHVTYFWNGNRSGKFDGETWQEVPSDVVPFEQRPWMKAAEITDAMIAALQSGQYKVLRCNFANGDMVGHTGNFRAATMADRGGRPGAGAPAAGHRRRRRRGADHRRPRQRRRDVRARQEDQAAGAEQGRQLQGQDRAHAQPGAADPLRQRQRRQGWA